MKSKVALLGLVSLLLTFAAMAQGIENDDMYFNSKDRAKLNAAKASEASYTASIKKSKREATVEDESVNPTDSYSARNVNPEFEARSNSQTAQADNGDYFINDYKYNNASQFNNWNNNFNNWYSNPWYGGNFYDPHISSWNSPYYGSRYDAWGNPWRNPYYNAGWGSSFSYHWGSSWNYGWGMNFGNYYNPYNAWAGDPYGYSPWNSYYGGGWNSYYRYPAQVVIIDDNRYSPAYGKRNSRSTQIDRDYNAGRNRTSNRDVANSNNGTRPISGGRVSNSTNNSSRQSDYYNRGWRNQSQSTYSSPSSGSNNNQNSSTPNTNTRSSWESNTRSSWSNSGGESRSSGYDGGRSSSGGGSSSGNSGGGSGSGSRSSGRGN